MAKLQILLCDTDEKYLMPLERKFIDGFEDSADIMIITDPEYLKVFFQSQRKIDILVINESLYVKDLEKHNIEFLFILMEQMTQDTTTTGLNSNQIYKYTSVKEIYNEIANCSAAINRKSKKQDENTKLIMVYSPIGGAGVTTLAIGLAGALAQNHRHPGLHNRYSYGLRLHRLDHRNFGQYHHKIQCFLDSDFRRIFVDGGVEGLRFMAYDLSRNGR